ncbi:hypothetical protein CYQ88_04875 [Hydrogenovibrio sp. SC-1]|uniref:hypothetical protein n=1 Tax=Hydrogenovibrio sp. SC-1 TaxID=2065820 RepID=UPI000C7A595A|nr:hypothetical protein [Hydrogenovibrio sp. SC-1]PLA74647.1 hypothetical protein CYQ88_04875 [Hydrogenovibrio sp. SC-1]
MQLTYQKVGKDHPMYGQVEFLVADGMTPVCYKTSEGYLPIASEATVQNSASSQPEVETRPLYVLSFKVNDETEEMTFTSKKKVQKTQQALMEKPFVSDVKLQTYQVIA